MKETNRGTTFIILILLIAGCKQNPQETPTVHQNGNSLIVEYNEDSIVSSLGKSENKKRIGKWLYFDDRGKLVREINYKEGIMHGTLTEFRDGKVFFTIPYVYGKKSGLYQSYNYICGTLASEGFFKDDKMHSLWYEYYKGVLIEISEYKDGEQVGVLYTHPNIKLSELPAFPDSNCISSSVDYD